LTPVDQSNQPQPYYAFNAADDNGFVIISGDDRFSKVLGYSDRGSFDRSKMPPQLKAMLDNFAKNTAKPSNFSSTHPSWNATFTTRAEEEVLLETAEWGQDAPFNAETPMFGDEHAPTGCVATAMAIVMKYHNWPDTYNWDAMPMKIEYDEENPPAPNPELARLMKDAGEAVYMAYGPTESGANMNWVGHKMQQVFKYSPDCQFITKQNFSNERWLELLKGNIDSGNPVIYQGTNNNYTQNHAFVLDGYNSTGYHVNWGWDGWFNGYYSLDALTPNEVQDYSCNNGMVLHIIPDKTGNIYSTVVMDKGYFYGISDLDAIMNISVENVVKGEPFHLANTTLSFIGNFSGDLGVALVSKDNKIKEVLATNYWRIEDDPKFHFEGHSQFFTNLKVTVDIEPTDKIQFVTRELNDNEYRLVLGTLEWPSSVSVVNYVPKVATVNLTVDEGLNFNYYTPQDGTINLPAGSHTLTNILQGTPLALRCYVENPEKDKQAVISINGPQIYGDTKAATKNDWSCTLMIHGDYDISLLMKELTAKKIELASAGSLKDKLTAEEALSIKDLTVTGKMNALDLWYIRDNCPSIESLDIKDVVIEAVEATDKRFSQFNRNSENPANTIPEWALTELGNLEVLHLPKGITAISDYALSAMNLYSLNIPEGVKSIGLNALFANPNLKGVGLLNPEPVSIHDCVFTSTLCPDRGVLYVPVGSEASFKEAPVWQDFATIIEGELPAIAKYYVTENGIKYECLLNEATVIGYEGEPKEVIIPEFISKDGQTAKVTSVRERAFEKCPMEKLVMPNSINLLGNYAFVFCHNLKSVKLSENFTTLFLGAFYGCESLTDINLEHVKELEPSSLTYTGLEKISLNKAVVCNDWGNSPFGANKNLNEFIVDEENPCFKAIDGILYRKDNSGLALECLPGRKSGTINLPETCVSIFRDAIRDASVSNLVINKECDLIKEYATQWCNNLNSITLPPKASILPYAFQALENLETVTFTGNLKNREKIFRSCDKLSNILIEAPGEVVELDGIFDEPKESVNILTSSTSKNFVYSDPCVVFVPGQCADGYKTKADGNVEVREMWRYNINRKENIFEIVPEMEGLTIDKVTINGKVVNHQADIYPLDGAATQDIKVDFTLFGHQKMTTHYTSEFNETVKDAPVTGVQGVIGSFVSTADVYTIDGLQVLKNASREEISRLANGVYIIREGNRSRKVVIKK
ncbi:MAG: C10 family peptidase, partial [Muribaculaceae bacterium]|nr:C10 family peptidase [Muribaculaceae bacterium]